MLLFLVTLILPDTILRESGNLDLKNKSPRPSTKHHESHAPTIKPIPDLLSRLGRLDFFFSSSFFRLSFQSASCSFFYTLSVCTACKGTEPKRDESRY